VGALLLAGGAAVVGREFVDDPPPEEDKPKAQQGLVPFKDAREDLSISYPAAWPRVPSRDPEVRLVAGTVEASLLVRTAKLDVEVEPGALDSAKKLTDKLVAKGESVKQLRPPRRIDNLGGLPGWLYIYSFKDAASGDRGAHAHYFLFRGKTIITLVFQTLPSERFATWAPVFDRLAATFRAGEGDDA